MAEQDKGTVENPVKPGDNIVVDPKNPFTSLTVISIIVAAIAAVLQKYGYTVSTDLQSDTVQKALDVIQFAGGVGAIVGRWRASRPLGVNKDLKRVVVKLVPLFLVLSLVSAPVSCAVLPGQDPIAVNAERTLKSGDVTVNTFLKLEKQNYAVLASTAPDVVRFANKVRDPKTGYKPISQAVEDSIKAYEAISRSTNSTPEDRAEAEKKMNDALADLEKLLVEIRDNTTQVHLKVDKL